MNKPFAAVIRYSLVCVIIFAIAELSPLRFADRFYRFDRAHIFIPVFYALLLVIGIVLQASSAKTWQKVVLKGSASGFLAGIVAHVVVVVVNRHGFGSFASAWISETIFSALTTTVVFVTPMWGIVCAVIAHAFDGKRESGSM